MADVTIAHIYGNRPYITILAKELRVVTLFYSPQRIRMSYVFICRRSGSTSRVGLGPFIKPTEYTRRHGPAGQAT